MHAPNGSITAFASTLGVDSDVSFTERLLETRRNEIKAFSIALRNEQFLNFVATPEGDDAFRDFLELAVREYGVSQKEIAAAISTSTATVSRWIGGSTSPPCYGRKSIVEAVAMIIDHNLDL